MVVRSTTWGPLMASTRRFQGMEGAKLNSRTADTDRGLGKLRGCLSEQGRHWAGERGPESRRGWRLRTGGRQPVHGGWGRAEAASAGGRRARPGAWKLTCH